MSKWQKFVKGFVTAKNHFKAFMFDYGLEILLFGIALGNAEVLREYLLSTGSEPTWQLTLAIYCTEILVVWASLWKTVGLFISTVLFLVSMVSIHSVFGSEWFGHSGFSLAIYCGSIGNYVRRNAWQELITAYKFVTKKTVVAVGNVIDLAGLTTAEIRSKLNTSLTHAVLIKNMVDKGIKITDDLIERTKC